MLDDPACTLPDLASLRSRLEEIEARKRASEDRCRTCGGSGVVPRPAASAPAGAIVSTGPARPAALARSPATARAGATLQHPG